MLKTEKIFAVLILAIAIFISFLVGAAKNGQGFYDLKLADILNFSSQILAASVIAYFIHSVQSKKTRINEIKVGAFNSLVEILDTLRRDIDEYTNGGANKDLKTKILKGFTEAQNHLNDINEIHEESQIDTFDFDVTRKLIIDYKMKVTGGSFASQNPVFDWQNRTPMNEAYRTIKKHLLKIRMFNGN
jgi:hypothetical protein